MSWARWVLAAACAGLLLGAGGQVARGLFDQGLSPVDAGPGADADCASCHAEIAAEWATSRHALAWTNGTFQREYKREPLDWCVRCHAPLATGSADSVGPVEAQGVTCAVCHQRDGRFLSAATSAASPHQTEVVANFASSQLCEGCHEFTFPFVDDDHAVRRLTDLPMQTTVSEFRASPYAGLPGECLFCHGATPFGHALPGGRDLPSLQHAAELTACAPRPGHLRLTVRNHGAGHRIPTGDVHRHFQLRAWRSSAPATMFEVFIGRTFEVVEGAGKKIVRNTSIDPLDSRTWNLRVASLGGLETEPVNVELRYVYTADEEPTERNHPGEPTFAIVDALRSTEFSKCSP